jgi:hypothetical protein
VLGEGLERRARDALASHHHRRMPHAVERRSHVSPGLWLLESFDTSCEQNVPVGAKAAASSGQLSSAVQEGRSKPHRIARSPSDERSSACTRQCVHTKIMLGVLIEVLCFDNVAIQCRLARERKIALIVPMSVVGVAARPILPLPICGVGVAGRRPSSLRPRSSRFYSRTLHEIGPLSGRFPGVGR